MKVALCIAVFLLAILVALPLSQALAPSFNLVLTSQKPFPAEPGNNVEVEVELQNNGDGEATAVRLEIVESSLFSLLPGEEKLKTFQLIGPHDSVRASYKLHIGEEVVSGEYEVQFRIFSGTSTAFKTEKVSVSVQGSPRLVIDEIALDPKNIEAGGVAEITVFVDNVGSGSARHLAVSLNSTAEIIPVLSQGSDYLGELAPGASAVAHLRVSIDANAEQKTYLLELRVTYQDESNTEASKVFMVGIPVLGTVNLDIIKTDVNSEAGTVEIEVANKGTTDAKSIEARLLKNGEVIGVDYISQIKPSKKTTFSFPILEGEASLEMKYTGPGLAENAVNKTLIFTNSGNSKPNTSMWVAVVAVIIVILGLIYWRRRRKKHQQAKA